MSNSSGSGELPRSSYSKDELVDIYALGKMWLETGQVRKAEVIMHGLNAVAPEFVPGWLGTALVQGTLGNIEGAYTASQRALKLQPDSPEAMLYVVVAALTLNDSSTAGTLLGEIGDLIEAKQISDPHVVRLYKMQLARYQGRGRV